MKQLCGTKRTTLEDFSASVLKRCLGAFDLTLLGIGAIICGCLYWVRGIYHSTRPSQWVIGEQA